MTNLEQLGQMFDYDLWANRQWLECLEHKAWPEPDSAIFQHILSANKIWLLRCQGNSPNVMPQPAKTLQELERIQKGWEALLSEKADDPIIDYKRTTGEALHARFSGIARHACNHGTYHRGELRGLCRARNDDDFPDTDFIGYVFEVEKT